MKTYLFTVFFVIFIVGFVRGVSPKNSIRLNNSEVIQFCNVPVLIAPTLSIDWATQITGMKISFSEGYQVGEDELIYSGTLSQHWSSTTGSLELTGGKSNAEYASEINSIRYNNLKSIPTVGVRRITISLNDIDYLPITGHFYRFISQPGISWSNAQINAQSDAMMYYGLRGYLATVTRKEENDFIKLKTQGVGWIGASDSLSEGEWRWVTGPEGLEDSGKGLLFWKGTSSQAQGNSTNFGPVNGAYQNWNVGEPNNSGPNNTSGPSIVPGEDYAHITKFSDPKMADQSYRWNDLPDGGGGGVDYTPVGYLIEYGGYPNEPILEISATLELDINTIIFKSGIISSFCEGGSVIINQPDKNSGTATYSWSIGQTTLPYTRPDPTVSPSYTTTYTLKGTRGTCIMTHDFLVPVIPKPDISFSIDSTTCVGYNLMVDYTGKADPSKSMFTWIFGGDTIVSAIDSFKINVPLGINLSKRNLVLKVTQNGCSNMDSIKNIHVKPALQPWSVNSPLLCLPDSFIFSVVQPDPLINYTWDFGDGKSGISPIQSHRYQQPGKYNIELTATNNENCFNSARIDSMVQVAPVPVAAFSMSDSIIYSNKPTVTFTDGSTLADNWSWNFGDSITSALQNPTHDYTFTGRHTVFLKVSSDLNCTDSVSHQLLVAFDRLFPPNGFSPNAPNRIDRVFLLNAPGIRPVGYHFKVLSRWDDIVFEAKDEIAGWDGRMKNGSFAPAGVYVWMLDYTDSTGGKHHQNGNVSLVF